MSIVWNYQITHEHICIWKIVSNCPSYNADIFPVVASRVYQHVKSTLWTYPPDRHPLAPRYEAHRMRKHFIQMKRDVAAQNKPESHRTQITTNIDYITKVWGSIRNTNICVGRWCSMIQYWITSAMRVWKPADPKSTHTRVSRLRMKKYFVI